MIIIRRYISPATDSRTHYESCEALRHFLSQHLCTSEVNFLMDYTLMKASGYKPKDLAEKLAEKHRLPTRLVKSRLKSLLKRAPKMKSATRCSPTPIIPASLPHSRSSTSWNKPPWRNNRISHLVI